MCFNIQRGWPSTACASAEPKVSKKTGGAISNNNNNITSVASEPVTCAAFCKGHIMSWRAKHFEQLEHQELERVLFGGHHMVEEWKKSVNSGARSMGGPNSIKMSGKEALCNSLNYKQWSDR